jgi:hypothetical protein
LKCQFLGTLKTKLSEKKNDDQVIIPEGHPSETTSPLLHISVDKAERVVLEDDACFQTNLPVEGTSRDKTTVNSSVEVNAQEAVEGPLTENAIQSLEIYGGNNQFVEGGLWQITCKQC